MTSEANSRASPSFRAVSGRRSRDGQSSVRLGLSFRTQGRILAPKKAYPKPAPAVYRCRFGYVIESLSAAEALESLLRFGIPAAC